MFRVFHFIQSPRIASTIPSLPRPIRNVWSPFAIGLLMFPLMQVGCQQPTPQSEQVRVEDLRYRLMPGGARILTGVFVNESNQPVSVAQIDISLFDANNRRVSSMFVVVRNVAPTERVEFREPVNADLNINGARVRSIILP